MNRRYFYSDGQVLEEAETLISTPEASTHTVATLLSRPQTTVWWHLTHRLPELDSTLAAQVEYILRENHKGGGR